MLVSMDSPAAGLVLVFCGFGTQHPKAAINFSGQGKSREVMSSSSLPLIHLIPSCCRQSLTGPSGKRTRGTVKTYQWSEWSPTSKRMKGRGEDFAKRSGFLNVFDLFTEENFCPKSWSFCYEAFLVPSDYAEDIPKEWWSQAPCRCLQERLDVV